MSDGSTPKIAVLVAGMHRSGTSALTRVLNIAGCDLPWTLMKRERHSGNVAGFWESQAIMDLNQEILASAGSFWDDWRPFDQDWYRSPAAGEFRERAQDLMQSEFGGSRLFVLKDPRLCRLMTFWVEAARAFGAQPVVALPIRNPWDVAASLQVRNHIDPSVGQLIWLRHTLEAEADSRALRRTCLRYEQLLSDAQAVVDRVGSDLGVSWPSPSRADRETKIAEFLSPDLHHHKSEDAFALSNPDLSDWVKESFGILDRWARGEVRDEDRPNLDRIKDAFDEATPACGHAHAAGRRENGKWVLPNELDALGYIHCAEIAMRRGDWEAACGHWGALRRAFPDYAAGYVCGAAALMGASRLDEAEPLAIEAAERFPDRIGGHYHRAEITMRRGDWEAACVLWGVLRGAFPDDPLGYARGAEALRSAGRLEEAEVLASEAVMRFPERLGGYVQSAEVSMVRGDWTEASERWGALRGAFPDDPLGYARGAEALRSAGRLEEAEVLASEAVMRFPERLGGYVQSAEVSMVRGDWTEASERWGALRRMFPDDPLGYVRGAEALRSAGRLEEAEVVANEAVSRFPDRIGGHYHRAEIAIRRGDWTEASERWGALRRMFPDDPLGYVRGAEALRSAGRLEEAEALAHEAVMRFPERLGGYVQSAEVSMVRGDWTEASERWGALRRMFPDDPLGYMRGAEALRNAGRLKEAEVVANEAVSRFPDRIGGHYHRAEIAIRRGDWAEASERWGALRRAFPDDRLGYRRGAEALRNAGRPEEAEALANEAAERFAVKHSGTPGREERNAP